MRNKYLIFSILLIVVLFTTLILLRNYNHKFQSKTKKFIIENELDIVYGSKNAPLTVYMFSSYNCAFCRKFFNEVFPLLKKEYIDTERLRFVVKLVDFTQNETIETSLEFAVCVNKYGDFTKLNKLLLTEPKVIFTDEFGKVIDELTLKDDFLAECMFGGEAKEYIKQNYKIFKINGLTGTPTFIINNKVYKGNKKYSRFVEIIEKEL